MWLSLWTALGALQTSNKTQSIYVVFTPVYSPKLIGAMENIDFDALCREVDHPDTEGFEFFVESLGTTIYRQYNEVCSVNQSVGGSGRGFM